MIDLSLAKKLVRLTAEKAIREGISFTEAEAPDLVLRSGKEDCRCPYFSIQVFGFRSLAQGLRPSWGLVKGASWWL